MQPAWSSDLSLQVHAMSTTPTHFQVAIPFIPAVFVVAFTLLVFVWRHLVPRFIKQKLDILTHDPVTIDDIPDAEPIPRSLPFSKIVLRISACLARMGIEVFLLVSACIRTASHSKLEVALHGCYVGLWVCLDFHPFLRLYRAI